MTRYDDLISLADLQRLINTDERESQILEYKILPPTLSPKAIVEAAKDISAFANALGGLIIYGVATDPKDKTRPVELVPIEPSNVDRIIHGGPSGIQYPIQGIRTKTLPMGARAEALLMDIPQSVLAPHQVLGECRYFRRSGVESRPMTHDLIELYLGRRMHSKVQPALVLHSEAGAAPASPNRVDFRLVNAGGAVGRDVYTRIVIPPAETSLAFESWLAGVSLGEPRQTSNGRSFDRYHGNTLYYPGLAEHFLSLMVPSSYDVVSRENPAAYLDVYAADSIPRRYRIFLSGINSELAPRVQWEEVGTPPLEL